MCTDKMVAIATVLSVACLHFFDRIIGHSQHFFKGMAAIFLHNHIAKRPPYMLSENSPTCESDLDVSKKTEEGE